jgi:hypothetical protein
MFRGKEIHPSGFSRRGNFIGERVASKGGTPYLTMWWPLAAPPYGEPGPWPSSVSSLVFASVKIGGSAFVSSNSENISYVTFLKHKNSRKQGTGTVASC